VNTYFLTSGGMGILGVLDMMIFNRR